MGVYLLLDLLINLLATTAHISFLMSHAVENSKEYVEQVVLNERLEEDEGVLQNGECVKTHFRVRVFQVLAKQSNVSSTVAVVAELLRKAKRHLEYVQYAVYAVLPVLVVSTALFYLLQTQELVCCSCASCAVLLWACIRTLYLARVRRRFIQLKIHLLLQHMLLWRFVGQRFDLAD